MMVRISFTKSCYFWSKITKNVRNLDFSRNFDKKFSILGLEAMKFSSYDQHTPTIMESSHSSLENGLTFVLIMSTYQYLEQRVKIGVKIPSFSIQIPFS